MATAPISTNSPTQTSFLEVCMSVHSNQMLNIMAVRTKSSASTLSEATTTVRVVARETPSGEGCDSKPCSRATNVTAKPNTTLLMTPLPTSAQTSTAPCIWLQKAP